MSIKGPLKKTKQVQQESICTSLLPTIVNTAVKTIKTWKTSSTSWASWALRSRAVLSPQPHSGAGLDWLEPLVLELNNSTLAARSLSLHFFFLVSRLPGAPGGGRLSGQCSVSVSVPPGLAVIIYDSTPRNPDLVNHCTFSEDGALDW